MTAPIPLTEPSRGDRWSPVLGPHEAAVAVELAREVVDRCCDLGRVDAAVAASTTQTAFPRSVHWRPEGLWQGHAGLALACAGFDEAMPGCGYDRAGREHLRRAVRGLEQRESIEVGLSAGLAGVATAAAALSRGNERYQSLLATLEDALADVASERARLVLGGAAQGCATTVFDVISGLAGTGRYLLVRHHDHQCRAALELILAALVHLSGGDAGLPGWRTPPALVAPASRAQSGPAGSLNLGLAHGIPGPLALLALAALEGVVVDGQHEAIGRTAGMLCQLAVQDPSGSTWPTAVPLGPDGPVANCDIPSRTAWCYGSPGIARSLWFAGTALGDQALQDLAAEAMAAVYERPVAARQIDSPTFCHGVAGLQQVTLRFAAESARPVFRRAAVDLHQQLVAAFEPASLLGYRNLEPGGARVDQPGLLDGAAGVALVLLASATGTPPGWDRTMLLS